MSIGIAFDDEYSVALSEYKNRNGMSVREIYDALDQRDRLAERLKKERAKYDALIKQINVACSKLMYSDLNYQRLANLPNSGATDEDRLEFRYRAKGLKEAADILANCLEDDDEG